MGGKEGHLKHSYCFRIHSPDPLSFMSIAGEQDETPELRDRVSGPREAARRKAVWR